MVQLEWVFLLQAIMGILMIVFLHKISRIQKQLDAIVKEVKQYVAFVTEADTIEETYGTTREKSEKIHAKSMSKKEKEAAQNHLIQSVLGEYFP